MATLNGEKDSGSGPGLGLGGVDVNGAAGVSPGSAGVPAGTKLHGRAFYESIGSPRFVLAPMVDQSEFAWRMLSRSFLPADSQRDLVAYTPMLHARMFNETAKFRDKMFQPLRSSLATRPEDAPSDTNPSTSSSSDVFLDGNPAIDRPLFVQFCANDPAELLGAAKYVAPFCDAVDLNLGCPQGIARKGKYGAFLQEDQELIFSLINTLHLNLSVPVTAKIRILETREKTLAYAQNVLKAGASILTVHGRQRDQKGHKTGLADWTMVRFLRENLPKETVLFANGNILRREDIDDCLAATGADGVMSAEGNLYDPAIFSNAPAVGEEGREYWRGRDGKGGYRMDAVFRRYMDIIYKYVLEVPAPQRKPLYLPSDPEEAVKAQEDGSTGSEEDGPPRKRQKKADEETPRKRQKKEDKIVSPSLGAMQPHLFHLLRALVAKHHHIRDALAKSRPGDLAAFERVLQMVEEAVADGLKEYEATDGKSWEDELANEEIAKKLKEAEQKKDAEVEDEQTGGDEAFESSLEVVKACKRPWWIVQPHVRPLPKEALAKGSLTLSRKEKAQLEKARAEQQAVKDRSDGVPNGHAEAEKVGGRSDEKIELPKEGLVCG